MYLPCEIGSDLFRGLQKISTLIGTCTGSINWTITKVIDLAKMCFMAYQHLLMPNPRDHMEIKPDR